MESIHRTLPSRDSITHSNLVRQSWQEFFGFSSSSHSSFWDHIFQFKITTRCQCDKTSGITDSLLCKIHKNNFQKFVFYFTKMYWNQMFYNIDSSGCPIPFILRWQQQVFISQARYKQKPLPFKRVQFNTPFFIWIWLFSWSLMFVTGNLLDLMIVSNYSQMHERERILIDGSFKNGIETEMKWLTTFKHPLVMENFSEPGGNTSDRPTW